MSETAKTDDAPKVGVTTTKTGVTDSAQTAAASGGPAKLPDDHPLVTALSALKAEVKTLKAERIDPAELKRLRELDESTKTEAEKQAARLAELEEKVKDYETRERISRLVQEVSNETGVPADLLRGSTKDELQAHAEQLKPLIAKTEAEKPRQGVVPTVGKQPTSTGNVPIAEQIAAAEKAGDYDLVAQLKVLQLGSVSTT